VHLIVLDNHVERCSDCREEHGIGKIWGQCNYRQNPHKTKKECVAAGLKCNWINEKWSVTCTSCDGTGRNIQMKFSLRVVLPGGQCSRREKPHKSKTKCDAAQSDRSETKCKWVTDTVRVFLV